MLTADERTLFQAMAAVPNGKGAGQTNQSALIALLGPAWLRQERRVAREAWARANPLRCEWIDDD